MTTRRKFLIERLVEVQSDSFHQCHDIMTITGFMTDDEVAKHLRACIEQAKRRAS